MAVGPAVSGLTATGAHGDAATGRVEQYGEKLFRAGRWWGNGRPDTPIRWARRPVGLTDRGTGV